MYKSYYNLTDKPFQLNADPKFLWLGPKHKEALAALKYGILQNMGFVLLTGDIGTGKTTLINALVKSVNSATLVTTVPDPSLPVLEFFRRLLTAFKIADTVDTKLDFLLHFAKFLERCRANGKSVLVIIDESQRVPMDLLDEIRVLSNIEMGTSNVLNIFFVGQNEFNEKLSHEACRAIRQRITITYHLENLSEKETKDYIQHRLKIAGTTQRIFTDSAIRAIYSFADGCPRLINIICEKALLVGYVRELKIITAATIHECRKKLSLPVEKWATASPGITSRLRSSLKYGRKAIVYVALPFVAILSAYQLLPRDYHEYVLKVRKYYGEMFRGMGSSTGETVTRRPVEPGTQGTSNVTPSPENRGEKRQGEAQRTIEEAGRKSFPDSRPQEAVRKEGKQEATPSVRVDQEKGERSSQSAAEKIAARPNERQLPRESAAARRGAAALPFQGVKLVIPLSEESRELSPRTSKMLDQVAAVLASNPDVEIVLKVYPGGGTGRGPSDTQADLQTAAIKKYLLDRRIPASRMKTIVSDSSNVSGSGERLPGQDKQGYLEIEMRHISAS